jgi:hypothetical protein
MPVFTFAQVDGHNDYSQHSAVPLSIRGMLPVYNLFRAAVLSYSLSLTHLILATLFS